MNATKRMLATLLPVAGLLLSGAPARAADEAAAPAAGEAAGEAAAPAAGGAAPAEADAASAGAPAAPEGPAPGSVEAIAAEADRLWKVRDPGFSGPNNEAMTRLLEEGVKKYPKSYDLWWRLSRAYWWRGDGADDTKVKSAWGKKGKDAGDKARALEPKKVEGHYFAAISTGAWAQGMGIAKALWKGVDGKFRRRLERALEIEPKKDCGGPMLSKGRYFYELPWPKYDGDASIEWLQKVLAACPKNPRAHLFLAQTLHKEDREDEAREHLQKALSLAPSEYWDPPEVRRVHRWAEKQKKAWEK